MKLELNTHTSEVSSCSRVNAAGVVSHCVALGYDGMVVTDHFGGERGSWARRIDRFLRGYHAAMAAAPAGFTVILGMELRFVHENSNDYLVYGFDEDFLCKHKDFDQLGLRKFGEFARRHGLLVCQAHPFRFGMTVVRPQYLDAIEVYNGHAGHPSHNEIAEAWCERHGLLPLSGSDYHGSDSEGAPPGGIVLHQPVADGAQLVRAIRAGEYELMRD